MFIHPTQNRSLSPREAARIQSFPDWFRFPKSRTHAFRIIGNAVPPLISEAVGLAISKFLTRAVLTLPTCGGKVRNPRGSNGGVTRDGMGQHLPCVLASRSRLDAVQELERLAVLSRTGLRLIPKDKFLRGWHVLLSLFPGLHPNNALDHGTKIESIPIGHLAQSGFKAILSRCYSRSGWPVVLELIGHEAWRRYNRQELGSSEFYCVEAHLAGFPLGEQGNFDA